MSLASGVGASASQIAGSEYSTDFAVTADQRQRVTEVAAEHAKTKKAERARAILAQQEKELATKNSLYPKLKTAVSTKNAASADITIKSFTDILALQIRQESSILSQPQNSRLQELKAQKDFLATLSKESQAKKFTKASDEALTKIFLSLSQEEKILKTPEHYARVEDFAYRIELSEFSALILRDPDNPEWDGALYPTRGPLIISGNVDFGVSEFPEGGQLEGGTLSLFWGAGAGLGNRDFPGRTFWAVEGTLNGRAGDIGRGPVTAWGIRATGSIVPFVAAAGYQRSFDGLENYATVFAGVNVDNNDPTMAVVLGAFGAVNFTQNPDTPNYVAGAGLTTWMFMGRR